MAQVDYFLKLDGVEGESAVDKFQGQIDVESWSWGESNQGTSAYGGGGGAGKVSMQDFHFVMRMSKATPKLMEACANGRHIPTGLLTCRKAGGTQVDFLKIKFTDLLVTSYQTGGSSHGEIVPTDQVSLNFSKIELSYFTQKADGSVVLGGKFGYDLKALKAA
jgi:type VI secretion system secreted protein Hcp